MLTENLKNHKLYLRNSNNAKEILELLNEEFEDAAFFERVEFKQELSGDEITELELEFDNLF